LSIDGLPNGFTYAVQATFPGGISASVDDLWPSAIHQSQMRIRRRRRHTTSAGIPLNSPGPECSNDTDLQPGAHGARVRRAGPARWC
jgi:hypothetical protein